MKQRIPALVGVGGHIKGEIFPLEYGKTITVGRSRKCTFSLRRIDSYRKMIKERGETTEAFRTVSGKHFEITMFNTNSIEIVNLSSNGTTIDNKIKERVVIEDVNEKTHEIRFGAMEVFLLRMEDVDTEQYDSGAGDIGVSSPADGDAKSAPEDDEPVTTEQNIAPDDPVDAVLAGEPDTAEDRIIDDDAGESAALDVGADDGDSDDAERKSAGCDDGAPAETNDEE